MRHTPQQLRDLRKLNLSASEFQFYGEASSELEIRSGRVGVTLPHPLKREHFVNNASDAESDEPVPNFLVTKNGFRFYSSTEVREYSSAYKGDRERAEPSFHGYRETHYYQRTNLQIKL